MVPTTNLVSNIGFGNDATHTTSKNGINSNMKKDNLLFPLSHPNQILRSKELDMRFEIQSFKKLGLINKLMAKIERVFHV